MSSFRNKSGSRHDGFTLLELVVAAALMAGMLILVFQIVVAVLNPWTRETDRVTGALQADAALDALSADLQSTAGGVGGVVLYIPADPAGGEPLRLLRHDAAGDLSVAAYWLDTWMPGTADGIPALFAAALPPQAAWEALQAHGGDFVGAPGADAFPPTGTDTLLAAGAVDFEVTAWVREGGTVRRAQPDAESGALRFPYETADGVSALPVFLDLRLRILSNAGLDRLSALRAGSAEFPEQTESEIHERFGTWFHRRVRLPAPR